MEEKITIDKETFKALAADTRIKILKFLNARRHTQSELSAALGLSVPTVKEHLNALEKAKLVSKIEEGYKWKYYELTERGKCVLDPERKKVWVVLALLVLSVASGVVGMLVKHLKSVEIAEKTAVKKASDTIMLGATSEAVEVVKPFPWFEIAFVAVVIILTGALIYYLKKSKILKRKKL